MKYVRFISVLGAFVILIYISTIGIKNIVRYNSFAMEYESLLHQYNKVLLKQRYFKSYLSSLENTGFLEVLVKQKLGYVKLNEHVIKFIME